MGVQAFNFAPKFFQNGGPIFSGFLNNNFPTLKI